MYNQDLTAVLLRFSVSQPLQLIHSLLYFRYLYIYPQFICSTGKTWVPIFPDAGILVKVSVLPLDLDYPGLRWSDVYP